MKRWLLNFCHEWLHWHWPDPAAVEWTDGASWHSTCKQCGKPIMQDSQGNWF